MTGLERDRLRVLTLALAVPLTLNVAYLIGVALAHLPACVPYLSGCTTTSSTGHAWPERAVFLAGMLGSALLAAWFWRRCARAVDAVTPARARALRWLGPIAALSLAAYALCIGQPGALPGLVRRLGIDGFFVSNYAAQLVVAGAATRAGIGTRGRRILLALCVALPLLAVAGEIAKAAGGSRRPINNVVEWNAILLVCAYYAAAGHYLLNRSAGRAASPRE